MISPVIVLFVILAPLQLVLAQGSKVPLMGYLSSLPRAAENARLDSLRRGLLERGYSEGKNLRIEYRSAEGKFDRLPALAAELVRLKPDLILTGGPTATRPAKEATPTIPIVMSFDSDPVGSGFVASLANPGGNITGLSSVSPEIAAKQLDLLRDLNPKLSRVMVLGTSTNPGNAQAVEQTNTAARELGIQLHYLDLLNISDVDQAYATAAKMRSEAVLMLSSPVTISNRKHVTSAAAKARIPTILRQTRIRSRRRADDVQCEHQFTVSPCRNLRR